jgi:tetratricopeptide (TPR) repeat protein
MGPEPTRRGLHILFAGAAVVTGAAGWLLLGPLWTIAGVVAGPPLALITYVALRTYATPDPVTHLMNNEPHLALRKLQQQLPSWRSMARRWPSRFREPLADNLLAQGEALLALNRAAEAPEPAAEAVAIYQVLAAERPKKFAPGLAGALDRQARVLADSGSQAEAIAAAGVAARLYRNLAAAAPGRYLPVLADSLTCQAVWLSEIGLAGQALAAASEAASICQDQLPADELPACAAQALLLQGRLLAGQGRCTEAAGPLARGWRLAASQDLQELLSAAAAALRTAYHADQDLFRTVWRAETGGEPPDWLTG